LAFVVFSVGATLAGGQFIRQASPARASLDMSHFLALPAHDEQGVWLHRSVGGVCGLLISLLTISWQEQNAQDQGLQLAQEKAQVQMSFNQIVLPSPEVDSTRLVKSCASCATCSSHRNAPTPPIFGQSSK
jgi:predicted membrane metal-binding protein